MPAHPARTVAVHPRQLNHRDLTGFGWHVTHQTLPGTIITTRIEQAALRLEPVTTRPAALLLIMFERLGHTGMDHIPNIGFIDTHTKSNGSYNGIDFFSNEFFLIIFAILIRHTGMVRSNAISLSGQFIAHRIDILTTNTIDDPGFTLVPIEQLTNLLDNILSPMNLIDKIRPVERTYQHSWLFKLQLLGNIITNMFGSCSRESCNSNIGKDLLQ